MPRRIPPFDIEGNDTAHKLAILTSLAFGTEIASDEVYVEGITNISIDDIHAADELGYRIKLLGVAQRTASGSSSGFIPPWSRRAR
jgi:homoserine dehydrogenase